MKKSLVVNLRKIPAQSTTLFSDFRVAPPVVNLRSAAVTGEHRDIVVLKGQHQIFQNDPIFG